MAPLGHAICTRQMSPSFTEIKTVLASPMAWGIHSQTPRYKIRMTRATNAPSMIAAVSCGGGKRRAGIVGAEQAIESLTHCSASLGSLPHCSASLGSLRHRHRAAGKVASEQPLKIKEPQADGRHAWGSESAWFFCLRSLWSVTEHALPPDSTAAAIYP
jgi:hypothetical protein